MNFKEMQSLLLEKGIKVTDEMIVKFQKYLDLLMEWNQKINLTALKTEEEIIEKHFYDSLLMAEEIKFDDQSLLDVGTGAGFPGIPLKIVFEDLFVTLLEPTLKRVNFLDIVIKELGLKKIVTINKRAEDYVKDARSYYDLVTARAVSRLNMLLELCMPLVKVDGLFLAMKGSKGEEEIQESINALKILNGEISMGHARVLSKMDDESRVMTLADKVIKENISVHDLEEISKKEDIKKRVPITRRNVDTNYFHIENELRDFLGTKVKVDNKKVSIYFDSINDLNRILEIMNIEIK